MTKAQEYHSKIREEMLAAYGRECVHCGSSDEIHFHHLEGDGVEHRRRAGGSSLCSWVDLRAQGFPPVIQVECAQCHRTGHAYACLGGKPFLEKASEDE